MTFDSDKADQPPAVFPPSTTGGSATTPSDFDARDLSADVHKLLVAATAPLSVEEIQRELGEPHVPEGQIVKALTDMGARKTQVDGVDAWSCLAIKDAEALAQRRADVLELMMGSDGTAYWLTFLYESLETQHNRDTETVTADIDALVDSGAVLLSQQNPTRYEIAPETRVAILRRGVEFIARATVPELTRPIEDRTAYELAATERFESEKKAKHVAIGERDRLATFLRENGQDVAAILAPPSPVAPGPRREEFMWEKRVEWSETVELELRCKDAALRAKLLLSEAALDAEKARHRAVREGIEEELREIANAAVEEGARQAEGQQDQAEGVEVAMIALALPPHVRSWMRSRAHHALAFLRGYLLAAEVLEGVQEHLELDPDARVANSCIVQLEALGELLGAAGARGDGARFAADQLGPRGVEELRERAAAIVARAEWESVEATAITNGGDFGAEA